MKIKLNPTMLILGTLAMIVSGWGLYTAMTGLGHAPAVIGALGIAVFELFAVGLAIHAVNVARDGDSPAPFNTGIVGIAILAAVIQFSAAVTEGKGVLVGTVLAMAPVTAITLWVVEVRRYFRLQGRAAGTVAQSAASIELPLWLHYPKAAWHAKKLAVIDRSLSADQALLLSMQSTRKPPKEIKAPVRIDRGLRAEHVIPELKAVAHTPPDGIPLPAIKARAAANGHAWDGEAS